MASTRDVILEHPRHKAEDRRTAANQRQVGGEHYGLSELQHWDVAHIFGLDHFQGSITKYVFRFRKKDGLKDLQKAQHYLEKLIELEYGPQPKAEPDPVVIAEPPAGHNRFLRKAARIGALYTMSVHAFAHCMGITEVEAHELLEVAKAEGDYVPPERRKTSPVDRGFMAAITGKPVGEAQADGAAEGDSLCGASLTECGEFAPPTTLRELLEEEYLKAAAVAWDKGLTVEEFAAQQKIEVGAARHFYYRVSGAGDAG